MSYIDTDHIAATSLYWKHFNLTSPDVKLPTLRNIQGIDIPDVDYGMSPGENGTRAWTEKVNMLYKLEDDFNILVTELTSTLTTTRNYYTSYIKSNQIDEDFFK
jgi:hypothetical protein